MGGLGEILTCAPSPKESLCTPPTQNRVQVRISPEGSVTDENNSATRAQQSVGSARESAMADDGDQNPVDLRAISSTFSGLSAQQVQNMSIRNNRLHQQLLDAAQRGATQHASDEKPDVPDVIMTGVTWHHMTPGMLPLDPHLTLNHLLTCSYTFLVRCTSRASV